VENDGVDSDVSKNTGTTGQLSYLWVVVTGGGGGGGGGGSGGGGGDDDVQASASLESTRQLRLSPTWKELSHKSNTINQSTRMVDATPVFAGVT
jgi:hypothetical protein